MNSELGNWFFWFSFIVFIMFSFSLLTFSRLTVIPVKRRMKENNDKEHRVSDWRGGLTLSYSWELAFCVIKAKRNGNLPIAVSGVKRYATRADVVRAVIFVISQILFLVVLILFGF